MGLLASSVLAGTDLTAAAVTQLPVAYPMSNGSVASSTAEATIGTITIQAGTITAVNQGFQWKLACTCGGTASPTLTVRMRVVSLAGTIICSGANTVTSATGWFNFDGWMIFGAVGSGGTFQSQVSVSESFNGTAGTPLAQGFYSTNATAWNTTVTNTILVTAQFNAANAANTASGLAGNAYML